MSKNAGPSKRDPNQARSFIETARALGADEDEAAFKEKLAVIARQKPKDEAAKQTRRASPAKRVKND